MKFYLFLLLTVLWFCFMTYLSHQDGEHTSETSRRLAELLLSREQDDERVNILNGTLRRIAHVVVFLVLTMLVTLTLYFGGVRDYRFLSLVALWALLDEATKPLIQGRHFAWCDVGLNLCGVGIGLIAAVVLR